MLNPNLVLASVVTLVVAGLAASVILVVTGRDPLGTLTLHIVSGLAPTLAALLALLQGRNTQGQLEVAHADLKDARADLKDLRQQVNGQ